MKARRLGPLSGFSAEVHLPRFRVRFHRRSKWLPWVVVDAEWTSPHAKRYKKVARELRRTIVKPIGGDRVKTQGVWITDDTGLKGFPHLLQFFGDVILEAADGDQPREPGTMFIQPRDGGLQVTLKEPSQAMMLRVFVKSWAALLITVEAALASTSSLWEVDAWARKRLPKKRR